MFASWLRKLLSPTKIPVVKSRRDLRPSQRSSFRPDVLRLEDRLAPAVVGTLSLAGNYMLYTGTSANNLVTISGTNSNFSLTDAAGTIQNNTGVPGLTNGATGAIPSQVTGILVNTASGLDTVTFNGLSTTRTIQVTADVITVNAGTTLAAGGIFFINKPGGVTILNGNLNSATNVNAGAIYMDGPVQLGAGAHTVVTDGVTDGDVLFFSTISGSGILAVNSVGLTGTENSTGNFGVLGAINVGGLVVGVPAGPGAPVAGANSITLYKSANVSGTVTLSAENAVTLDGSVISNGAIGVWANLDGIGTDAFTQAAGTIASTLSTATAVRIVVNTAAGGTGNAYVGSVSTGTGGTITINARGGSIVDNNGVGVLNLSTGVNGTVALTGAGSVSMDTSTSTISVAGINGDINIRNISLALTTGVITTAGNITISNNNLLTVNGNMTTTGAFKTVTLTTTSGAGTGNIIINDGVTVSAANGSIVLNASGDIEGQTTPTGTLAAPTITLTAVTGIGDIKAITIAPGASAAVVTATNTGTTGGIVLTGASSYTVANAVAQGGAISLTTTGASDLTTTGNVTTLGSNITLTSGEDIVIFSGYVFTDTGNIVLTPTRNLSINVGSTVSTSPVVGGSITVTAPTANTVEAINGTLAAGSAITINGAGAALTSTITVSGSDTSGTAFTIQSASTGTTIYSVSATINSGGALAMTAANNTSAFTLSTSGTENAAGATTFTAGTSGVTTMVLGATLNSLGALTIHGASGSGNTDLILTGNDTSAAAVTITAGTSGALLLTQNGTLQGTTVSITGASGSTNVIDLNNSVTATGGAVTVTTTSTSASFVSVGGTVSTTTTAQLTTGGTGATNYVVTPSTTSLFSFTFSAAPSTLFINTPSANIVSATANFSAPITFTPASGLKTWTSTGGTVTVTPTAP